MQTSVLVFINIYVLNLHFKMMHTITKMYICIFVLLTLKVNTSLTNDCIFQGRRVFYARFQRQGDDATDGSIKTRDPPSVMKAMF